MKIFFSDAPWLGDEEYMRLGTLFHVQHAVGHGLGLWEKRKIIFFSHFSSFFRIFFLKVDVEIWGRSIHDGWARFEQRNMRLGKSFFLKKTIFLLIFFNFWKYIFGCPLTRGWRIYAVGHVILRATCDWARVRHFPKVRPLRKKKNHFFRSFFKFFLKFFFSGMMSRSGDVQFMAVGRDPNSVIWKWARFFFWKK